MAWRLQSLGLFLATTVHAHPGLNKHVRDLEIRSPVSEPLSIRDTDERTTWCYPPDTPRVKPADPDMCQLALHSLIPADNPSLFSEKQTFFGGTNGPRGVQETPITWPAGYGVQYCEIVLTGNRGAIGKFRLLDIALAADAVVKDCVRPSKNNIGGGSAISEVAGRGSGFTAFVNGRTADPDLNATDLVRPVDADTSNDPSNGHWFCFEEGLPSVYPVDLDRCQHALDLMFDREDPFSFFRTQTFYNGPNPPSGTHGCPDYWDSPFGNDYCKISLTANTQGVSAQFTLSDAAHMVRTVLNKCVPKSKQNLAGGGYIKDTEFFVVVNGKRPGSVGNDEIPVIPTIPKPLAAPPFGTE